MITLCVQRWCLSLFHILSFCLLLSSSSGIAATDQEIAEKSRELKRIQENIAALTDALHAKQEQRKNTQQQLRQTEQALNQSRRESQRLEIQIPAARMRLTAQQQQQQELQQQWEQQQQQFARQLRQAYWLGQQSKLKLLLNQQEPATISRVLRYYDYFNRARLEAIVQVSATLTELARVNNAITAEIQQLQKLQQQQQVLNEQLAQQRQQRQDLLTTLKQQIRQDNDQLKRLQADEKSLQKLIESLNRLFADIPPEQLASFGSQRGKLPWPLQGRLLNRFGQRHTGSDWYWHGLQIAPKQAEQVKAIAHGRVVFADWLNGFGLLMIVDHGDEYLSLYGQNEVLYQSTGDWVTAGQIIADVGNTTVDDQPAHLYFEIRHKGKPVDPVIWCQKR